MSGHHYVSPILYMYGIFTFEGIIHPFKMYSSGFPAHSQTLCHPPQESASPFPAAPAAGKYQLTFCLCGFACSGDLMGMGSLSMYVAFHGWLFPVNTLLSRFTHSVATYVSPSFFFTAE